MVGEPSFFELGVRDAARGRVFYEALFGWHMKPGPSGGFAIATPAGPGGLHGNDPEASPLLFFAVDDMDAAVERVLRLGGSVETTDHEADDEDDSIARFGRFKLCRDDQGSRFGLHRQPD